MAKSIKPGACAGVSGVDEAQVSLLPGFWRDRAQVSERVSLPAVLALFDDRDVFHAVENFRIAAGLAEGDFRGTPFADGDFYKLLEALGVAARDDCAARERLEGYAALVCAAQREDGYISTKQIIRLRSTGADTRLDDINSFELYNMGHLMTAACVCLRCCGSRTLLGAAVRAGEWLTGVLERAAAQGGMKSAVCPSHYMGLAELWRTTGERRWLRALSLAIDLRDGVEGGTDDNQDRTPLRRQRKIVGHAVRATYLYAGVADLAAETGEEALLDTLDAVWRSMTGSKMYITGGLGALYNGVSPYGDFLSNGGDQKIHQAFGYEYQLPNVTAYNETCASIGGAMWARRMFVLRRRAEYFDAAERMYFNTVLAAVSLGGDRFFYENMLRREEKLDYTLIWPLERVRVIDKCFCCPTNLVRAVAEIGGMAYCAGRDRLWTGLYMACRAELELECGARVRLCQTTDYPWDGLVRFAAEVSGAPAWLMLRVPGWCASGSVEAGGASRRLTCADAGEYIPVELPVGTSQVVLSMDMPPRLSVAHPLAEELTGQAAVERGPLVYCVEGADVPGGCLDGLYIDPAAPISTASAVMEGVPYTALDTVALRIPTHAGGSLYAPYRPEAPQRVPLRLVPYFMWDNRGFGRMKVWLPLAVGGK